MVKILAPWGACSVLVMFNLHLYVLFSFYPVLAITATSGAKEQEKEPSRKSSTSLEEDDAKEELLSKNRTDTTTKYETKSEQKQEKQAKQVIPGLGVYSDSSDSEASSSDS